MKNDTIVVKQSASSMIGIFGGMLVVGLGALLWAVGGKLLGFVWFSLAAGRGAAGGRGVGLALAVRFRRAYPAEAVRRREQWRRT